MSVLREAILAAIRRSLADDLGHTGPVELHDRLAKDLQVDSMGAVVLAVGLEDAFRVKLTGLEASSVATVGDLVGVVERAIREDRADGEPPLEAEREAP